MKSMDSNTDESRLLHISRPMWAVAAAVLGLAFLGKLTDWSNQNGALDRDNRIFGDASAPRINPVAESDILNVAVCADLRFYTIDSATDSDDSDGDEIHFVDPAGASIGWIRRINTATDVWPPPRHEFSDALFSADALRAGVQSPTRRRRIITDQPDESEAFQLERLIMSIGRHVHVTDVEYGEVTALVDPALMHTRPTFTVASVSWACPHRSAAWPVRVHLGRCAIGDHSLLIGIEELAAHSGPVDYRSGIFRLIAEAIRTSSRANSPK